MQRCNRVVPLQSLNTESRICSTQLYKSLEALFTVSACTQNIFNICRTAHECLMAPSPDCLYTKYSSHTATRDSWLNSHSMQNRESAEQWQESLVMFSTDSHCTEIERIFVPLQSLNGQSRICSTQLHKCLMALCAQNIHHTQQQKTRHLIQSLNAESRLCRTAHECLMAPSIDCLYTEYSSHTATETRGSKVTQCRIEHLQYTPTQESHASPSTDCTQNIYHTATRVRALSSDCRCIGTHSYSRVLCLYSHLMQNWESVAHNYTRVSRLSYSICLYTENSLHTATRDSWLKTVTQWRIENLQDS